MAAEITVSQLPTSPPPATVFLDVREDDEWSAGRIAGAVHVPLAQVPDRLAELADLAADPLYVVCRSGVRSGRAAAWLAQHGVPAVNVAGGMQAWAAAGRAMVADCAEPVVR
ncbi:MAG: rhodanese-like domain-containing protein [Angustibacter sp.]